MMVTFFQAEVLALGIIVFGELGLIYLIGLAFGKSFNETMDVFVND